jgi:hypothetical protein
MAQANGVRSRDGQVAQRRPGQASPKGTYGELLPGDGLTHRSPPGKDADLACLAGQGLDQACHPGLDHHEGQAVVEGGPHRLGLPAPARPGCPDPAPSRPPWLRHAGQGIPGTGSGRDWDAVRAGVVRHRWASSRAEKAEREGGRLSVIGLGPCVKLVTQFSAPRGFSGEGLAPPVRSLPEPQAEGTDPSPRKQDSGTRTQNSEVRRRESQGHHHAKPNKIAEAAWDAPVAGRTAGVPLIVEPRPTP